MASKWTPSLKVRDIISDSGFVIRGKPAITLYNATTFYLDSKWWRLGITVRKKSILFDSKITMFPPYRQAQEIVHELTHEAQYIDYGKLGFVARYIGEWIKSGFDYDDMKRFGLEKEALEAELKFREIIS